MAVNTVSIIIIILSVIIIICVLLLCFIIGGGWNNSGAEVLSMEEFKAAEEGCEELGKSYVDDTGGGFGGILGMKVAMATSHRRYIESFISK